MSKLSLDRFVGLVERSKLIDPPTLDGAISAWKQRATLAELDDAAPCAEHLVETGLLTRWQARKLLEGRHRGFYLGNYRLLDHLGTGGMSSVYLAEHVRLRRRAAIKILPHRRSQDHAYLERFQVEGQAVAALDHPNIVRAYDLDDDGTLHFLVMEYIDGRDLCHLVEEDGPLDFHTAAEYCAQAATGLEHAHAAGLIHRDIKPANLLLDAKGTVKILDLGLAKFAANADDGQADQVVGTADYLAPEQALNSQTVDQRADIYALGCTLYFLLSGHPPFASGTSIERVSAHQQQQPPSLLVDRPDAPQALVAICNRMMEKSPDARFQSASEVRAALANWLVAEAAAGRAADNRAAARFATTTRAERSQRPRHSESHINLISGSAPDLRAAVAAPTDLASPLTDTEVNLTRATLPITAQPPRSRDSSSYGLPQHSAAGGELGADSRTPPGHPTPPPIPIPPGSAIRVRPLLDTVRVVEVVSTDNQPLAIDEKLVLRMHRRGARRARVWWTLVTATFVLGALVWLVTQLAR
jgi:serine/threonine protein kinase